MSYGKKVNKMISAALIAATGLLFTGPVAVVLAEQAPTAQTQADNVLIQPKNHKDVCMVTNNVAPVKMIPVKVEGKTYYGCCMGCVGKLKNNRSVRYAIDPVTGREVDKASAFIVADKANKALYFESRESAEKYFASVK